MDIITALAKELSLLPHHVKNVISLLDDGKTVPYIARYRKELTGSMDDQTIRILAERLERMRSVLKRQEEILKIWMNKESSPIHFAPKFSARKH